jgi:hypothetical protein
MFTGLKEQTEKKNKGSAVVGYDLGKTAAQISYCIPGTGEVETVSGIAGTEQYNIPVALCKRKGVNQWYYGKEAYKYAKDGEGILVEDLLTLAERGEEVIVEGEGYDPAALLTLFVKRSLSLLNLRLSLKCIDGFMFTVEELTPRIVDVLGKVAAGLAMHTDRIMFQSHVESFYYYMLYQDPELWKYNVMIFDYENSLKSICLECNRKTTPCVVFINSNGYPDMERMEWQPEEEDRQRQREMLDKEFLRIARAEMEDSLFSTVYLLGDGFKDDWAQESLRYLCRNRRVFQGNNLYSRGACLAALERMEPGEKSRNYVYLGADKLKSNVGMKVIRRGEDSYFAILDAGTNWYEACADFEVILEEGNTLDFIITPLTGEKVVDKRITLEGLPERPRNTTRLRLHIEMTAVNQVSATIEDLGFGEIFPSSGKGWEQSIIV